MTPPTTPQPTSLAQRDAHQQEDYYEWSWTHTVVLIVVVVGVVVVASLIDTWQRVRTRCRYWR